VDGFLYNYLVHWFIADSAVASAGVVAALSMSSILNTPPGTKGSKVFTQTFLRSRLRGVIAFAISDQISLRHEIPIGAKPMFANHGPAIRERLAIGILCKSAG
jgi:hypothetical protein